MVAFRPGPGPRNLITDVPGLKVGQAEDSAARTGVTVILPDERAVAACDVRGGAPGTRETEALSPENLVDAVDAVVLSGGSVYGLGAADGVVAWLGARGRGYGLPSGRVKERLGSLKTERAVSLIAIHAHDIPNVFPPAALAEAEAAKRATLEGREECV